MYCSNFLPVKHIHALSILGQLFNLFQWFTYRQRATTSWLGALTKIRRNSKNGNRERLVPGCKI
jgi:hypothetical protein